MKCADHIAQDGPEKLSYCAWHDKAQASHDAGERQTQCDECNRWIWPWEMRSGREGKI